jgi:putative colanic acid biosynthesis acetyltransferase WcaB
MWAYCAQDAEQNRENTKGRVVAFLLRLAAWCKRRPVTALLAAPYLIFYKVFVEWFMGIDIPCTTSIGPGLQIYHGHALVVNGQAVIGRNCVLRQCTTIGNAIKGGECPTIGDNVNIGANVCIIGSVKIGNNVIIGAGSIVIKDIPDNCVVAGNPSRIIRTLR